MKIKTSLLFLLLLTLSSFAQTDSTINKIIKEPRAIMETPWNKNEDAKKIALDTTNVAEQKVDESISFMLKERHYVDSCEMDQKFTEAGIVCLIIEVDHSGNVINSHIDFSRSNTTSMKLINLAKKAANIAKFNKVGDTESIQRGFMTFHFELP